jgi:hypothetical protein
MIHFRIGDRPAGLLLPVSFSCVYITATFSDFVTPKTLYPSAISDLDILLVLFLWLRRNSLSVDYSVSIRPGPFVLCDPLFHLRNGNQMTSGHDDEIALQDHTAHGPVISEKIGSNWTVFYDDPRSPTLTATPLSMDTNPKSLGSHDIRQFEIFSRDTKSSTMADCYSRGH